MVTEFSQTRSEFVYFYFFQNLPFASECDLKPSDILKPSQQNVYVMNSGAGLIQDMSQPPPGYPPALPYAQPPSVLRPIVQSLNQVQKSPLIDDRTNASRRDSSSVEIVNLDPTRSQSRSPDRFRRHSRSRSPVHRDRDRDRDRERKSRSRSRSRRRRLDIFISNIEIFFMFCGID